MIGAVIGQTVIGAVIGHTVIGAVIGQTVIGAVIGHTVIGAVIGQTVIGAVIGQTVIGAVIGHTVIGAVIGQTVIGAVIGHTVIGAVIGQTVIGGGFRSASGRDQITNHMMINIIKPRSHEDFNSLLVAYFSIQIQIHLSRLVESRFIQIYVTASELKSSCEHGYIYRPLTKFHSTTANNIRGSGILRI